MQITGVFTSESRLYIPLRGWDSVEKALAVFAMGSRGSSATERITADQIAKSTAGTMGADLFTLTSLTIGIKSTLVTQLLQEAKQALAVRRSFHRSYDYDGMGTPFFKTGVTIKRQDDELFYLGLNAAYVGDGPEIGLAESLGIPRGLLACNVEIETTPLSGGRFEFDFEPVVRKLDALLETGEITGAHVVQGILTPGEFGVSQPVFDLPESDGMSVSILPDRVTGRFDYRTGRKIDTWWVDGSRLGGKLARDYESSEDNAMLRPTIQIKVRPAGQRSDRSGEIIPVWLPERQQEMIALANQIAAAFA